MNSALLNPLREHWNKLTSAERRLATLAGAVLGLLLLYLLLWLPVQRQLARLRVSVPEERVQLQRMRQQAASIQPLRARRSVKPAPGTLLSVIEQSATARGIRTYITRLEADGSNGAQLTLEAISFNSLISWIVELQDSQSLLVDSISVDAQTAPGIVSAKLKLRVEGA